MRGQVVLLRGRSDEFCFFFVGGKRDYIFSGGLGGLEMCLGVGAFFAGFFFFAGLYCELFFLHAYIASFFFPFFVCWLIFRAFFFFFLFHF